MDINKANIANALHSVAKEHIVATADEIYDNSREQYQTDVNEAVGKYEDNPEFVEVKTDSEGKILYGVQQDGNFYFGAGVPSQIQDLVNATKGTIDEKIALIEAELQKLDDVKVDKEEGKSLIPTQYIQEVEDNPEFVKIVLDSEGKILYGVKANGDFMFGCGVPSQIQERLDEIYDTYGKYEDSPEYVRVYLDKEGKILWGIKSDGSIYYGTGIPPQVKDYVDSEIAKATPENYDQVIGFLNGLLGSDTTLQMMLASLDAKIEAVDGKVDDETNRAINAEAVIANKVSEVTKTSSPEEEDERIILATDEGKEVGSISAKASDDDSEVVEFVSESGSETYAKMGVIDDKKGMFAPAYYDINGNPIFEVDTEKDVLTIAGKQYKLIPFVETS